MSVTLPSHKLDAKPDGMFWTAEEDCFFIPSAAVEEDAWDLVTLSSDGEMHCSDDEGDEDAWGDSQGLVVDFPFDDS